MKNVFVTICALIVLSCSNNFDLHENGMIEITFDEASIGITGEKHPETLFFVWCKELGLSARSYFDTTTHKAYFYDLPPGEYHIRLIPAYTGYYRQYGIYDTLINVPSRAYKQIRCAPPLRANIVISDSLKSELTIYNRILTLNGLETDSIVPDNLGIIRGHIAQYFRSYQSVDTLPEYIDQLTHLEWLRFFNTSKIRSLPASLGNLKKLSFIELLNTPDLTDLPMELANLPNLEALLVHANSFKQLPEVMFHLPNATALSCNFYWVPSQREKEWALKWLFHGNTDSLAIWEADLISSYGTKKPN